MSTKTIDRARALGPLLRQHAADAERLRRLPDPVVDALVNARLFKLFLPAEYGGEGCDLATGLAVIEETSYHEGAAGWCVMIGTTTSLLAGFLDARHRAELFSAERAVTGGFAAPVGRATRVAGGIEVSGSWSWGSGIHHCTAIGGGCLLREDGAPPQWLFAFFDQQAVAVADTWYTAGLRGTGSTDYSVSSAFVPDGRYAALGAQARPLVDAPLYRLPNFATLAAGVASVALGLARRALDELAALAATKQPAGSSRPLAERPATQGEVAACEALLLAARAFFDQAVAACWRTATAGSPPTLDERRRLRLAATHATQTAAAVTQRLYLLGGGSAVFEQSALQRVFRDVFVATQHAMVAPRTFELSGRLRLGLATDDTQL